MTRRACGGRRTGVRLNCPPSLRGAHRPLAVALHVRHRTHFKVWSACADSDHCDRRSPALWWAGHHAREHMSEGCSLRRQPANARSRTARERLEPRRPTRVPRLISALYLHSQSSQNWRCEFEHEHARTHATKSAHTRAWTPRLDPASEGARAAACRARGGPATRGNKRQQAAQQGRCYNFCRTQSISGWHPNQGLHRPLECPIVRYEAVEWCGVVHGKHTWDPE